MDTQLLQAVVGIRELTGVGTQLEGSLNRQEEAERGNRQFEEDILSEGSQRGIQVLLPPEAGQGIRAQEEAGQGIRAQEGLQSDRSS